MQDMGLDALVVYAWGSTLGPATRTHGYIRYLCDWDSHQNPAVLLLRPGLRPVLLVSNIFSTFYARQYHWIEDVRFVKAPDLCPAAARVLNEEGRGGARVGVVGRSEIPVTAWEAMTALMPQREWVDFTPTLDANRVVKDAEQLAIHQQAARICDDMFEALRRELKTPRPGFQLQAEMERVARYAGAEYCMTWLTVGPQADYSRFFREECRRTPQTGDQVIAGIYLIFDGHWGHAIRSGTMGPASQAHRDLHTIALSMADAMQSHLRTGQDLNLAQAAAENTIAANFPADQVAQIFRFRHGHGLGHSYEDPVTSQPFPQIYDTNPPKPSPVMARAGMLFELHPNLFVPGMGGGCIGDMVVVTDSGNERLTQYPRELIDWAR